VSRPRPDSDDIARIEALRAELRRLRAEVMRLEEDKHDLERRNAILALELEQARAKFPPGISPSQLSDEPWTRGQRPTSDASVLARSNGSTGFVRNASKPRPITFSAA